MLRVPCGRPPAGAGKAVPWGPKSARAAFSGMHSVRAGSCASWTGRGSLLACTVGPGGTSPCCSPNAARSLLSPSVTRSPADSVTAASSHRSALPCDLGRSSIRSGGGAVAGSGSAPAGGVAGPAWVPAAHSSRVASVNSKGSPGGDGVSLASEARASSSDCQKRGEIGGRPTGSVPRPRRRYLRDLFHGSTNRLLAIT